MKNISDVPLIFLKREREREGGMGGGGGGEGGRDAVSKATILATIEGL